MYSISSDGECNIGARIDEESSSQFPVLSFQIGKEGDGLTGEGFQFATGEIFFAQLDVVDPSANSLFDFLEESTSARGFVGGEGGAVGDVVEKAAVSR